MYFFHTLRGNARDGGGATITENKKNCERKRRKKNLLLSEVQDEMRELL